MEKQCVPDKDLPDWAKPKPKGAPPSAVKGDWYAAAKKSAFIIGTALLAFASLRNSITWQFEQFWGGSKTFYQDGWTFIYRDVFKENKFVLATFGSHGFFFVYFWLNSIFFMVLDIFEPKFFMKYKIQEEKKVERSKLLKAIRVVMFNQFVGLLVSFPLWYILEKRGMTFDASDLPTFGWFLVELVVFTMVEELGFYYSHRLGHHPRLYKHFHKIHHEWTAPVSIIGIYNHWLEHIIANLLPMTLGPMIMGSHLASFWMWSCIVITSTQISHGGYHLPFLPSPEAHDFHHLKFTNNFGVLGVLDRLHGTDAMFVQTNAYDRHIFMMGLEPVRTLFPDEKKKKMTVKQD